MTSSRNAYSPESVSPPGRSLRRALAAMDMSQAQLASRLGKTEKFVSEVVNGKAPISPETALHLEHVLGTPASFWNNRERAYREHLARANEARQLAAQAAWARRFPLRTMVERGWLPKGSDRIAQTAQLLDFFGIATPREWSALWDDRLSAVAFRQSKTYEIDRCALSAWLRYGEIAARKLECDDYNRESFREALATARALTTKAPEIFEDALVDLCAKAGVAVVFTPDLPKTRVSASVRWLTPRKALIQLGLRYKTDDHLWSGFYHEAVHVLKHGKKTPYLETDGLSDDAELEAGRIAADILIPRRQYEDFVSTTPVCSERIVDFAGSLGIAPGIVVGRLQHDGVIPYTHCNGLKRRFKWTAAAC
ncbi:MAG: helix-turn-helix domain-containing protein [Actinomycetes bacterium]